MPGRHTDNAPGRQKDGQTDRQVDPVAIKSNILLLLSQRGVDQSRGTLFFFTFISQQSWVLCRPAVCCASFLFVLAVFLCFFLSFVCASCPPLCPRWVPTSQGAVPALPDEDQAVRTRVCVGVYRLACFGSSAAVNTCLWRYTDVPIEQRTHCQPSLVIKTESLLSREMQINSF